MAFDVRLIRANDRQAVQSMLSLSYGTLLKDDYGADILQAALPYMQGVPDELVDSGSYFVISEETKILAAGGWSVDAPGGSVIVNGQANVRKVGVHPDCLRRGIGSALMKHIHLTAKRAGIARMHCLSSIPAIPFYRANGYMLGGKHFIETLPNTPPFESYEMTYDLKDFDGQA